MIRGRWIRRGALLAAPMLLASCSSHPTAAPPAPPSPAPPAPAPFYVDGGAGSERGNFVSYQDSETTGPGGVHCVLYVWDRPLTAQTALRLRSQSCEQPGRPGLYIANELDRVVIPLTSSTLWGEVP